MLTESPSAERALVSPRAASAHLTLQLRASMQDAADAEAVEASIDQDAALAQVQARLRPLIEARRQSLDAALETARAEATAAVAAARLEAAAILAPPTHAQPVEQVEQVDVPVQLAPPQINIVIDAEAFARVIATVLGEHLASLNVAARPDHGVAAAPSAKRSSWTSVRPLDVLLSGLAALIALVILAAWLA